MRSIEPGIAGFPDAQLRIRGSRFACPGMAARDCIAVNELRIGRGKSLRLGDFALEKIAYVNGSYVPLSEAKVSILDRGFLFADGIYEVSAVLEGRLVDNASHLARLQRSVGAVRIPNPYPADRWADL